MRRDGMRVNVGLAVLENCNRWIDVSEISYLTGATPRQISTVVGQMEHVKVTIERTEWGKRMMAEASPEEMLSAWVYVMRWRYGLDDIIETVRNFIPYAGWISNRDLTTETGVALADLIEVSKRANDIVYKPEGNITLFRRLGDDDVFEHNGAPQPGDRVTG